MAKLRPPSKRKARKDPRSIRRSVAASRKVRNQQESAFLNLPSEIRQTIFRLFTGKPHGESEAEQRTSRYIERGQLLVTRRSLWRVCCQVTKEWGPLFFRDATVVVRGASSSCDEWIQHVQLDRTLTQFNYNFLKKASESMLRNVRKLEFDASLTKSHSTDFASLMRLPKMLNRYPQLVDSILEIRLFTTCISIVPKVPALPSSHIQGKGWEIADTNQKWETVLELFEASGFDEWHVTKETGIEFCSYDNTSSLWAIGVELRKPMWPSVVDAVLYSIRIH